MRSSHWCQFVVLVSISITSSSLTTSTQTAQFVRLFRNLLSRRNSDLNEDNAIIARFLTSLDQLGEEEEALEGRNIASDALSERMEPVREEEKNKHDHEQNSIHKHWSTNQHSHEHQEVDTDTRHLLVKEALTV